MAFDTHVRRGHPSAFLSSFSVWSGIDTYGLVIFGLLIIFGIIQVCSICSRSLFGADSNQLALSAWLTSRYNMNHDYLNISERDRVRYVLFCSIWTVVFSFFFFILFIHSATGSVLTSVAAHLLL